MRDAISIPRIAKLHPKVREEVTRLIDHAEANLPANQAIRVVQGLRTIAEQDALYAQGRTAPGKIVTKAKGGSSYHNYGLAVDLAIIIDKDGNGTYETISWDTNMEVVKVFEAAGWEWGGRWKFLDKPHFQKTFGYSVKKLFDMKPPGAAMYPAI